MFHKLNNSYQIILGSGSPRRKQLLKEIGLDFRVEVRKIEEVYPSSLEVKRVATYLAELKNKAFTPVTNELIITSDTTVVSQGLILGKPKTKDQAFEMIKSLSNKEHEVISGVCFQTKNDTHSFSTSTKVFFDKLSDDEINYYIDKYKPFDKAGAYGIQEWIGMIGIKKIEGCFYNVMGFPVNQFVNELKQKNLV